MSGGLGGSLLFRGTTLGGNMKFGGNPMFLEVYRAISLDGILSSLSFSSAWMGDLVTLGVAFCSLFYGGIFGIVGLLACAFALALVCTL